MKAAAAEEDSVGGSRHMPTPKEKGKPSQNIFTFFDIMQHGGREHPCMMWNESTFVLLTTIAACNILDPWVRWWRGQFAI